MPIAVIKVYANGLDVICNKQVTSTNTYTPEILKSTQAKLVDEGYQVFTHYQY